MSSTPRKIDALDPVARTPIGGAAQNGFYLAETLRPLVCLIFVIPFLLIYELGVIFLDNHSIRNGLDVWLSGGLKFIGIGELLLLPLITTFMLFAMHHWKQDRWQVRPLVFAGMIVESIGLALIVLFAAKAQHVFLLDYSSGGTLPSMLISGASETLTVNQTDFLKAQFVSFCGAGLYEELVFRLLMLPGVAWLFTKAGMKTWLAVTLAIAITSLLFAAAHYDLLNPAAEPFELPGFMVRVVASVFFCLVFLFRGFGVAVGTHVAYDVLAQLPI